MKKLSIQQKKKQKQSSRFSLGSIFDFLFIIVIVGGALYIGLTVNEQKTECREACLNAVSEYGCFDAWSGVKQINNDTFRGVFNLQINNSDDYGRT